jgi:Swi5-dependent recombination DNA repair protein 1
MKIEQASRKWLLQHGRLGEDEEEEEGELEIDADLVELCEKWRFASRQAAEELYAQVRERVNRMGGPRAWKESQKRKEEEQMEYEQEERDKLMEQDDDEDSEDEDGKPKHKAEKRDLYAEYGDPETENEKSQRVGSVKNLNEKPGDEDEFTMGMMLSTLNVEVDVIGYDRERQTWAD